MTTRTNRRSDNVLPMQPGEVPAPTASQPQIEAGDIARRAFEIYCDRGREDGHDVDDWLYAERELRGDDSATTAA